MKRPDRKRRGFVLTEAVVAGTLLLMVVQVSWWVTAVQSVVATRVVTGARILDETRVIHHVLASEVDNGQAGTDWIVEEGELRLRAFRGMAFGCSTQPSDGWAVAVSGYREPNADKDSVLVLSADGSWRASALVRRSRRRNLECQDMAGFSTEVWFLDPPRVQPLAGRYFERGAYRFSDGAFRYRHGRSGWQPLTGTGIAVDSATLVPAGVGGVEARMTWEGPSPIPPSFQWTTWSRR